MIKRLSRLMCLLSLVAATVVALGFGFNADSAIASDSEREIAASLRVRVASLSDMLARPADRDALTNFYAARNYRPVWVTRDGLTTAGKSVTAEIAAAGSWALDENEFPMTAAAAAVAGAGNLPADAVGAAEYEISTLVLKYARQARGGRIPEPERQLSSYLDRRPTLPNPSEVVAAVMEAAEPGAALRAFHPKHEQFQKLQKLYAKLRSETAASKDTAVPETGPELLPNMRHDDVMLLRRRLGVDAGEEGEDFYGAELVKAVKAFQREQGLRADGYIGKKSRRALRGGDSSERLASLAANMEMWRWMPLDLGEKHLFVNIPGFTVSLFENGKKTLEERVVVGKHTTKTPVFSRRLSTIVLKPAWQLPDSIKLEKLVASKRDGESIEDKGYVIKKGDKLVKSWTVDWSKAEFSAYTLFQPSGDANALGNVKFLFPNKHSVYLHDTPNKALFDEDARLYSHGCIRVQNPLKLAQKLFDLDKGAGVIDAEETVDEGPEDNRVALERPVPIHLAYFTVSVSDEGEAVLHGDPYGHEGLVKLALAGKWEEIERGEDHLAAVDTEELKKAVREAAESDDGEDEDEPEPVARRPQPKREYSAPAPAPRAAPSRVVLRRFSPPPPRQVRAPKYFTKAKPYKSGARLTTMGEMMQNAYPR